MLQTISRTVFSTRLSLPVWIIAAVLLLTGVVQNIYGQSCPTTTTGGGINIVPPSQECAELETAVYGYYPVRFTADAGCNVQPVGGLEFEINWGDGNIETLPPLEVRPTNTPNLYSYVFGTTSSKPSYEVGLGDIDEDYLHTYPKGLDACGFNIKVTLRVIGSNRIIREEYFNLSTYHQTDDYSGAIPLTFLSEGVSDVKGKGTLADPYLVCVGQQTCIQFMDQTELNCNQNTDGVDGQYTLNNDPRVLQFEYGAVGAMGDNGAGNVHTTYIPNVSVGGVQVTGGDGTLAKRYDGGDGTNANTKYTVMTPGATTGRLTNRICIGETQPGDEGKMFYVRIYNWNKCNAYPGGNVPTDTDRETAVYTTAVIKLVKTPPAPDPWVQVYCNRNFTDNNNNTVSIYSNGQYTANLTHDYQGMGPGRYYYFESNAAGTAPTTEDLTKAIYTADNCTSFNPVTNPNIPASAVLNPTTAQEKHYWVIYEYNVTDNQQNILCTSKPSRITYIIRENISKQPGIPTAAKSVVCPEDVVKFTVNGNDPTSQHFGGAITYVWQDGSNYVIEDTENNDKRTGGWATIRFTASPVAPNQETVTVKLYRRWTNQTPGRVPDEVLVQPDNCPPSPPNSPDCNLCSSAIREVTITVNPRPTATLSGSGTICAGETLNLTVSGFKGAPGTTAYDVKLTPDGTFTNFTDMSASAKATVTVNPAGDGTSTTYKIVELKASPSGCVNTGLSSTATVHERKKLDLTGVQIDGLTPVCENTTNTYTLNPAGNATSQPPIPEATEYYWKYNSRNYSGAGNGRDLPAGSAVDATTAAVRNIEVYWRYTTNADKSGLPDRYCPSEPITKPITVMPRPTVERVTPTRTICRTEALSTGTSINVNLTGMPARNWTVTWRVENRADMPVQTTTIAGNAAGKAVNLPIPILASYLAPLDAGTYTFTLLTVTQANNNGCSGTVNDPKTASIKLVKQPTATIAGSTDLCEDSDLDVSITLDGERIGKWTVSYTVDNTNPPTTLTATFNATPGKIPIPKSLINQTDGTVTTITITNVEEETKALDGSTFISCSNDAESSYEITTYENAPPATIGYPGDSECIPNISENNPITAPRPPTTSFTGLDGNTPGGTFSGNGIWSVETGIEDGGSFADPTVPNTTFTVTKNGRYVLKWTIEANNSVCDGTSATVVLDYAETPEQANAGPDKDHCYNLSEQNAVRLEGNAANPAREAGEWTAVSWPGSSASPPTSAPVISDRANNTAEVTGDQYGEYIFEWKLYNACNLDKNTDRVTITFLEQPNVVEIPAQYWCANGIVSTMPEFTAPLQDLSDGTKLDANFSWEWVGTAMPNFQQSGNGQFVNEKTPDLEETKTVPVQYHNVKVTAAHPSMSTCTASHEVAVWLKPRPVMKEISPTTVCEGAKVTFELDRYWGKDVTYSWKNDNEDIGLAEEGTGLGTEPAYTYQFTAANPDNNSITAQITAITATVDGCTGSPTKVLLTVHPKPILTPPTSPEFCPETVVEVAQTTVLSDVDNTEFNWSYAGVNIGFTSTAAAATTTTDNLGEFTSIANESEASIDGVVTITGTANGCSSKITYGIKIKPRPVVNKINDEALCPKEYIDEDENKVFGGKFTDITFKSQFEDDITYTWTRNSTESGTDNPVPDNMLTFGDNITGSKIINKWSVTAKGDEGSPANGCESKPMEFELTVHPRPVTNLNPVADQEICSGEKFSGSNSNNQITIYDNAGGISSFQWKITEPTNNTTFTTGAASLTGTQATITFPDAAKNTSSTGSSIATLSVTATSTAGCVGPTKEMKLTVKPAPVISDLLPIDVCSNTPFKKGTKPSPPTFTNTSGSPTPDSYTWNFEDGNVSTVIKTGTERITEEEKEMPDLSAGKGTIVADAGTFTMPDFTTVANNSTTNRQAEVTVTADYKGCTSEAETFTVTVRPIPVVNKPDDQTVCPGTTVKIPQFTTNLTNDDASIVHWTLDNTGIAASTDPPTAPGASGIGNIGQFTAAANSGTLVNPADPRTGTFTLTPKMSYPMGTGTPLTCVGDPKSFKVTVDPTPEIYGVEDMEYCHGVSVPQMGFSSPYSGVTYSWKSKGDNIGLGTDSGKDYLPGFTTVNNSSQRLLAGVDTITVTATGGKCLSEPEVFTVTVKPVPQLNTYADLSVCAGDEETLGKFALKPEITYEGETTYSWIVSKGWIRESNLPDPKDVNGDPVYQVFRKGGTEQLSFTPDATSDGTSDPAYDNPLHGDDPLTLTISVTPTLAGCEGVAGNVYIHLNPTPKTTPPATDGNSCIGESGSKTYYADGNQGTPESKYEWSIVSDDPKVIPSLRNANEQYEYVMVDYPSAADKVWTGKLSVTETNRYGCKGKTESTTITAIPYPTVEAGRDREICFGDSIKMEGKYIKPVDLPEGYRVVLEWSPSQYIVKDEEQTELTATAMVAVITSAPITFSATVFDEKGNRCPGRSSTMNITVRESPAMPIVSPKTYCASDPLMKMTIANPTDATVPPTHIHWALETSPDVWAPISNSMDSVALSMNLKTEHPDALPYIDWSGEDITDQQRIFRYRTWRTQEKWSDLENSNLTCESGKNETMLTVNRSPETPTVEPLAYCFDKNYPLYTLKVIQGNNVVWYKDDRKTIAGYGQTVDVYLPDVVSVEVPPVSTPPVYTAMTYYASTTSASGCSSPLTPLQLTIYPLPILDLELNATEGCAPFELKAVNKSTDDRNTYTWQWSSIDDAHTTNAPIGETVTNTYELPPNTNYVQTTQLQLIGISKNKDSKTGAFCRSMEQRLLTISPGVMAKFELSDTVGCSPLQVFFNSTSEGAINSRWYWNEEAPPAWAAATSSAPTVVQLPSSVPNTDWYGMQGANPVQYFDNSGRTVPKAYHVWLQVDNNYCAHSKDTTIWVYALPEARFEHNVPAGGICPPDSVMLTNLSDNLEDESEGYAWPTLYAWNFSDGSVDTTVITQSPIYHKYESWNQSLPKQYQVDMTAINRYMLRKGTDSLRCSATLSRYFIVNPQVQALFTRDSTGCAPAGPWFQSQSKGAVSWHRWDWGDGTRAGAQSIEQHYYTVANPPNEVKTYTVTLSAGNGWCRDNTTHKFHLYPRPVASFSVDKISGCQPLTVTFTNTSGKDAIYPNLGAMTYTYNYGDGRGDVFTDDDPLTHTHAFTNTLGTNLPISPELSAKNKFGCTDTFSLGLTIRPYIRADFTMEDTIGCSGTFTTKLFNTSQGYADYEYDFGDGITASGGRNSPILTAHQFINPTMHRDTVYYVRLVVTQGGEACPDTVFRKVKVLSQPRADFRPLSDYTYPAAPIQIDNNVIPLPDRDYLKYLWSWNEQGSGYVNNFSSAEYPSPLRITDFGSFAVTQRVVADNGVCSDSKTYLFNIIPPAPYAEFDEVPPACVPCTVKFENTSKYGMAYLWDFGDKHTSNEFEPTHIYTEAGTYKVILTVFGDGLLATSNREHYVVVHPQPQAGFEVQPNFLWVGQPLRAFNYTAHNLSNGIPYDVWYRWDWGDNTSSDSIENPSHMYLKAGSYQVKLTTGTFTNPQCISVKTLDNAVELENSGDIILPNIFKPSTAGEPSNKVEDRGYKNYLFYPPVLSPTRKYRFLIYNRWGQLLFETTQPDEGWNGYFKGRLCDEGVYIYRIEGVFETGQSFSKMGDITLLR